MIEWMNRPVWNKSKSNENLFAAPAKRTLLSSAFLLYSGLLLMLLIAAGIYFLQKPELYFLLAGFCILLFLLLAHRNRKINSSLKRFDALLEHSSNPVKYLIRMESFRNILASITILRKEKSSRKKSSKHRVSTAVL